MPTLTDVRRAWPLLGRGPELARVESGDDGGASRDIHEGLDLGEFKHPAAGSGRPQQLCLLVRHAEDLSEAQGLCRFAEEEVLGHVAT